MVFVKTSSSEREISFKKSSRFKHIKTTETAVKHQTTKSKRSKEAYFNNQAREYLCKKLIRKKVQVSIDYTKPEQENFEKRICASVLLGKPNVAEQLVRKGLAFLIFHKDDQESSKYYDALLVAYDQAQKEKKGVHSTEEPPQLRIVDASKNTQKARSFLPFFKRAGRFPAVAEYVASGNRLKLFVKKDNCKMTFLLAGIK